MRNKLLLTTYLFIVLACQDTYSQGLNHNFLIGYTGIDTNVVSTRAILNFTDTSINILAVNFNMKFGGAQANISDQNGNLLMYTNGCYIADSTGNMMQNGDSLNPNQFSASWCAGGGMPIPNSDVFLPWPGDSTKYILLHQTSTDTNPTVSTELFYSIIDITLNNGLGAVTLKNVIAFQTALCPAISTCKHANGRDWWIIMMSPYSNTLYKLLLTPNGILNIGSQASGLPANINVRGTVQFSPDGNKFGYYNNFTSGSAQIHRLRVLDFDRCTGWFSNPQYIDFSAQIGGFGLAFSPNSKYIYYGTFNTMLQVNTDTSNIAASIDTIALYDNYCFPYSFTCTDFWYKYLAANGKIYIGSGGTTIDMHFINYPDSEGIASDMHQHGLRVPCYTARENVYHPNYYLGPELGSGCDTLAHVGIYELSLVKNMSIYPNPSNNGNFRISYLLPQNKNGVLTIHDLVGKQYYKMDLPQWSTMQDVNLPELKAGIYTVTIVSDKAQSTKKLVVVK